MIDIVYKDVYWIKIFFDFKWADYSGAFASNLNDLETSKKKISIRRANRARKFFGAIQLDPCYHAYSNSIFDILV